MEAELRAMESAAQTQHRALLPKVELAARRVQEVQAKVNIGLAQRVDLAEATLHPAHAGSGPGQAVLDRELIRRRLQQPGEAR